MSRVRPHRAVVDHLARSLAARRPRTYHIPGHLAAAVAVMLVERDGQSYVPLTVRSAALPKHSGQISFPGGKRDANDHSFAACALREANEEIGVAAEHVRVLGEIDEVPTPSGFTIRPIVCELLVSGAHYQPNPGEVTEVFEEPLSAFANPASRRDMGEREMAGIRYRLHAYHVNGRVIWGATARMIEQIVELLGQTAA